MVIIALELLLHSFSIKVKKKNKQNCIILDIKTFQGFTSEPENTTDGERKPRTNTVPIPAHVPRLN